MQRDKKNILENKTVLEKYDHNILLFIAHVTLFLYYFIHSYDVSITLK